MYIFRNYNTKNLINFSSKKDLLQYIDMLCNEKDLILPTEQQAMISFGESFVDGNGNRFDGFCLSGCSDTSRSHLLGFYGWTRCDKD